MRFVALADVDSATRSRIAWALTVAGFRLAAPDDTCVDVLLAGAALEPLLATLGELRCTGAPHVFVLPTATVVNSAARLLQAGATDVLGWSEAVWEKVIRRFQRWHDLRTCLALPVVRDRLIGSSPSFRSFLEALVEVALFGGGGVLLLGPSGTGKEAAARVVHDLDPRPAKGPMVTVDCTTIVPELAGSELFGHERGAFTGATCSREGAVSLADGGTLFLDEIGELPLALQPQLLRLLQERCYKPVGANAWRRADFRVICATNRPLEREVGRGRFRADLYHRIATHVLTIPSLPERRADIPPLVQHFLQEITANETVTLDGELEAYLLERDYPGNVRELRQLAEAIAMRYVGCGPVGLGDLPRCELRELAADAAWNDGPFERAIRRALQLGIDAHAIEEATRDATKRIALELSSGSVPLAARRLGLSERALQKWRANRKTGEPAGVDTSAELDS